MLQLSHCASFQGQSNISWLLYVQQAHWPHLHYNTPLYWLLRKKPLQYQSSCYIQLGEIFPYSNAEDVTLGNIVHPQLLLCRGDLLLVINKQLRECWGAQSIYQMRFPWCPRKLSVLSILPKIWWGWGRVGQVEVRANPGCFVGGLEQRRVFHKLLWLNR